MWWPKASLATVREILSKHFGCKSFGRNYGRNNGRKPLRSHTSSNQSVITAYFFTDYWFTAFLITALLITDYCLTALSYFLSPATPPPPPPDMPVELSLGQSDEVVSDKLKYSMLSTLSENSNCHRLKLSLNQAVEKRTSLAIFWLLYSWYTDWRMQSSEGWF